MTHLLTVGTGWARGANGASQTLGREGGVRGQERSQGRGAQQGAWGAHTQGSLVYPSMAPRTPSHPGVPALTGKSLRMPSPHNGTQDQGPSSHTAPLSPECMGSLHPSPSQPQGACHQHRLTRPPSFPGAPSGPFSPTSPCGIQKTGHLREALQDPLCQRSVLPEWAPGRAQSLDKKGLLWSHRG